EHECAQLLELFDGSDLLFQIRASAGCVDATALTIFCTGLQGLAEMGFAETRAEIRHALLRSNGRHELAVQMLLDVQQAGEGSTLT
ncbi:hypothetical protein T492DRAFT_865999, partial [Pavlovales sp. CCMP2436]